MGSLSSVVAPIASLGVGSVLSAGKFLLGNQEYAAKDSQNAENTALQKRANLLDFQRQETERLSKLRKAIASQRARFGGQGIGSASGSSEAVIEGLQAESDIERQNNLASTALKNQSLDQKQSYQSELNLLQKQQFRTKSALGVLND